MPWPNAPPDDVVRAGEIEIALQDEPKRQERAGDHQLSEENDPGSEAYHKAILRVPWIRPPNHRKRKIILPKDHVADIQPIRFDEKAKCLRAIAQARCWLDELIKGNVIDIASLAQREKKTTRSVRMILSLAFLDPALVKAAAEGCLPRGYGASRLMDLPAAWASQWQVLGLERPS